MAKANPVSPKVTAASLAGAVTVIVVWGAEAFGVDVPSEVASAFTLVLMTVFGYVVRDPQRAVSVPQGKGRHRANA